MRRVERNDKGGVQSVTRAFDLLEVLADAEASLPLAEIAARAQLSRPTAHRLLKTLQQQGYVHQGAAREYGLGPGLIRLGQQATPRLALQAQSVLADLEQAAEETANLAMLDGDLVAYISQGHRGGPSGAAARFGSRQSDAFAAARA
jgi:IclR family acetate operon transcriptional repressor